MPPKLDVKMANQQPAPVAVDNVNDPTSPDKMDRDHVLSSLGYKPERLPWKPVYSFTEKSLCHRCGKKVYPVERVDVGELYHTGCFKCVVCASHLTIKTFYRDTDGRDGSAKEVYCSQHVPKGSSHIDHESLEIKAAIEKQKKARAKAKALGVAVEEGWHYDQSGALEHQHVKRQPHGTSTGGKKVKRRSTLRTSKDFARFGVYDAQEQLERVHKEEEDALYTEIFSDRKEQVRRLEAAIRVEREATVSELIRWFTEKNASHEEREEGLQKVEAYFSRQREARITGLLARLALDEQAAVTRMVEKHAQEMLTLIARKDKQAERELRRRSKEPLPPGVDPNTLEQHSIEDILYSEEEQPGSTESQDDSDDEKENMAEDDVECVGDLGVTRPRKHKTSYSSSSGEEIHEESRAKDNKGVLTPAMIKLKETLDRSVDSPQKQDKQKTNLNIANAHGFVSSSSPLNRSYEAAIEGGGDSTQRHGGKAGPPPVLNITGLQQSPRAGRHAPPGVTERSQVTERSHSPLATGDSSRFSRSGSSKKARPPLRMNSSTEPGPPQRERASSKDRSTQTRGEQLPAEESTQTSGLERPTTPPPRIKQESQTKPAQTSTPQKKRPAYEMNFILPASPRLPQRRGITVGTSGVGSSEEESGSESSDTEGEYDTKAEGHLLRHPGDDSKLHIDPDEEDDEDEEWETDSEDTDDSEDSQSGGHRTGVTAGVVRAVPVVSAGAVMTGSEPPRVVPPRDRKSTLYASEKVFEHLDNQAIQESKKEHSTFTDLVRKLSRKCQTELQKVRAIFRWITVKDLNKLDLDASVSPESPLGLLRGIKMGKESYHTLFKRLCSYAGLHCEVIEGYSKGAGYRPGAKIQGAKFRNQWTAVNVEGSWRFINCNWGARHVKGPGDTTLTYKCDEFYFLTDPEDHIYQHFPDRPEWQLLKKPLTMDEFVRLPVTKSPFYNKKLHFSYKYPAVLTCNDGVAEIRVRTPRLLPLAAQLKNREKKIPDAVLSERVLVRVINNSDNDTDNNSDKKRGETSSCTAVVSINLPMPGVYYLDLFVESDWQRHSMDHCCAFAVRCAGTSERDAHVSFPPLGMFGATPRAREMGVVELRDPLVTFRQTADVSMSLARANVRLTHTLQLWNYRDRELEDHSKFAMLSYRDDDTAKWTVAAPTKGHYVLSVLAEDQASNGTPELVFRYILDCRVAATDARGFPRASKRWQHCRLLEPLQADLPLESQVLFRVESPAATEMVVVIGSQWHALQRNNTGVWQGVVPTGRTAGKALVYAKFMQGKAKYIPCLEYNILSLRKYNFV